MDAVLGAAGTSGSGDALVKDVTTATFQNEVIAASREVPIIVDLWAPWCGPCKTLGPILEKAVRALNGKVRMVKVNIDDNPEIAQALRVQSIPTVYAIHQGRPVDGFMGALPESQVKQFLQTILTRTGAGVDEGLEEALAQAKLAIEEGQAAEAAAFLEQVIAEEAANPKVVALLARAKLALDDAAGALAVLDAAPSEIAAHAELEAVRAAIDLARQAEDTGPLAELQAAVAADPSNHQARFDLAMAQFAAGQREAAVDSLLDIVKRDRKWNEEAARKQLVKFFEAWGFDDPLSIEARRRLSGILFS
jgi:putative thioredoxin